MSSYFSRPRLLELISAFSAVFGILGTCFGIWSFFNPVSRTALFYTIKDSLVYQASGNFSFSTTYQNSPISPDVSNLYEARMILWNEGGDSLSPDEMRKPLVISAGNKGGIIDLKILNVKSIIEDNFEVHRVDNRSFQVRWKKFDPGMAVSLAVLHFQPDDLLVIGAFGPKYELSKFPPRGRAVAQGAVGIISLLLIAVMGLVSVAFFDKRLNFLSWRFGFPVFMVFLVTGGAIGAGIGYCLYVLLNLAMNLSPPAV